MEPERCWTCAPVRRKPCGLIRRLELDAKGQWLGEILNRPRTRLGSSSVCNSSSHFVGRSRDMPATSGGIRQRLRVTEKAAGPERHCPVPPGPTGKTHRIDPSQTPERLMRQRAVFADTGSVRYQKEALSYDAPVPPPRCHRAVLCQARAPRGLPRTRRCGSPPNRSRRRSCAPLSTAQSPGGAKRQTNGSVLEERHPTGRRLPPPTGRGPI
jgi:hypothetical protein